jgi:hypothetical protein
MSGNSSLPHCGCQRNICCGMRAKNACLIQIGAKIGESQEYKLIPTDGKEL